MLWFNKKEKLKISGIVERFAMKYSDHGYVYFDLILLNSDKSEKSVIEISQDIRCSIASSQLTLTKEGDVISCELEKDGSVIVTLKNKNAFRNLTLEERMGQSVS